MVLTLRSSSVPFLVRQPKKWTASFLRPAFRKPTRSRLVTQYTQPHELGYEDECRRRKRTIETIVRSAHLVFFFASCFLVDTRRHHRRNSTDRLCSSQSPAMVRAPLVPPANTEVTNNKVTSQRMVVATSSTTVVSSAPATGAAISANSQE